MKITSGIGFLLSLFSCTSRGDIVFSASDELHYLELYEKNSDFEILYNGVNTAVGKYEVKDDTIFLSYNVGQILSSSNGASAEADKLLTKEVIIDRKMGKIQSIDGKNFCADIRVDRF